MEKQRGSGAKDQTTRVQTGNRSDLPNSNDGKRKRICSSRSKHQASEEHGHVHPDGTSQGMIAEKVWINRSIYEQADDAYQTLLSSGCSVPPVSSSSKDRIPRTLVFRAKRNASLQHQKQENHPHTRSLTSPQQQRGSTHHHSSSEPQRGRHAPSSSRKRVYSETECAPQRMEKIIMSELHGLAQEKIWFDKSRYDEAECCFYEGVKSIPQTPQVLPP